MLWKPWWELMCELRSACARTRTFLWMAAIAMRQALPEFIASAAQTSIFVKFLRDRLDLSRSEGMNLAA